MEADNVEMLLKMRYECEDRIKKYEKIPYLNATATIRVMIRQAQKKLKMVNKELMKRAM